MNKQRQKELKELSRLLNNMLFDIEYDCQWKTEEEHEWIKICETERKLLVKIDKFLKEEIVETEKYEQNYIRTN